jgi:hypothetical protein
MTEATLAMTGRARHCEDRRERHCRERNDRHCEEQRDRHCRERWPRHCEEQSDRHCEERRDRHCEGEARSNPDIPALDCFAALAMTRGALAMTGGGSQ